MPAPLAKPPTLQPAGGDVRLLGVGVGGEHRAWRPRCPPRRVGQLGRRPSRPRRARVARGSCSPMMPVEQTATSMAPQPSTSAAFSAVACVVWKPSGPVQALAPPELRTTARSAPPASTCCDQSTGAALTWLVVNIPAAAVPGPSLTTRARSSRAAVLDARRRSRRPGNPAGAPVTLTARLPSSAGPRSRGGRARGSCTGPRRRRCPW